MHSLQYLATRETFRDPRYNLSNVPDIPFIRKHIGSTLIREKYRESKKRFKKTCVEKNIDDLSMDEIKRCIIHFINKKHNPYMHKKFTNIGGHSNFESFVEYLYDGALYSDIIYAKMSPNDINLFTEQEVNDPTKLKTLLRRFSKIYFKYVDLFKQEIKMCTNIESLKNILIKFKDAYNQEKQIKHMLRRGISAPEYNQLVDTYSEQEVTERLKIIGKRSDVRFINEPEEIFDPRLFGFGSY